MNLIDALGAYWNAAYAEGREGREHDTEDGAAQQALFEVRGAVATEVAAERERIAAWYDREGRMLDEDEVTGAILAGEHTKTPNV